jgi:transposase
MSVSPVARQHGIAPSQRFRWRQLCVEGAMRAGEEVVPAFEYGALRSHVRELQRLLGEETDIGEQDSA